jgi:peptidoglycan/LPS O-acetylase OafA/YrhL
MALVVVFSHLFQIWLLDLRELQHHNAAWLSEAFYWTPLGPMMDGLQAVFVFFVISGLAVTYPVLKARERGRTLAIMTIYRYPRLALPTLTSCVLAYVLLSSGAFFNQEAAAHHADAAWYASLYTFPPDFAAMLRSALWDTFFNPPPTERSWNTVLWTMSLELYGSFMLFALLAIVSRRWLRLAIALCLAAYWWTGFYGGYFCGFFVGYFLAELLVASERSDWIRRKLAAATPLGWLCLVGALLSSIGLQSLSAGEPRTNYLPHMNAIAAMTVIGVILVAPARAWLSKPASQYLGRISFGIYLTHLLVICSFSSALFVEWIDIMPYWVVVLLIGSLSLGMAIGTAHLFTRLVDDGLLRWVKRTIVARTNRLIEVLMSARPPAALP